MKTRKEIVDERLAICSEVANWALREGFEVEFLKISWNSWIDELYALRWGDIPAVTIRSTDRQPSHRTR